VHLLSEGPGAARCILDEGFYDAVRAKERHKRILERVGGPACLQAIP